MVNTTIVVSLYNSRPETLEVIDKLFFPSLLNNITPQTQLIVLDDRSPLQKETNELIEKYRSEITAKAGEFKFVSNEQNLGFAGSYTKGMKMADGEVTMVINDDTCLPQGSVSSLVGTLKSDSSYGMVGPVTNTAWGFQKTSLFPPLKDYSPQELERIEQFSLWLKGIMSGRAYEIYDGLIGFCIVSPTLLLRKVDYFDTRYAYGTFEDLDLFLKVRKEGFKVVVDGGTFVEHGGPNGASISLDQHQYKKLRSVFLNGLKFCRKWNRYYWTLSTLGKGSLYGMDYFTITNEIRHRAASVGSGFVR